MRYDVRSQISGTAYSVYNFDLCELTTLQPMYRDQLLALWRRYCVLGVTIEYRLVNKSSTVDLEVLSYHGSGTTVSALTFSQALEYKYTTRRFLTTSGNAKSVTFTQTIDLRKYLPKGYISDSDFWGDSATKPTFCTSLDGYQAAIGFFTADGTSTMTATMDRRIVFHVRLFELAAVANSLTEPPPTLHFGAALDNDSSDEDQLHSPPELVKSTKSSLPGRQSKKAAKQIGQTAGRQVLLYPVPNTFNVAKGE